MKSFTNDEMNIIYEFINNFRSVFDSSVKYKDFKLIEQKDIDNYEEGEYSDILDELVGYQVKIKSKGEHKNDGQLVDYYFTFKNPDGIETEVYTEMCLIQGWNEYEDVQID